MHPSPVVFVRWLRRRRHGDRIPLLVLATHGKPAGTTGGTTRGRSVRKSSITQPGNLLQLANLKIAIEIVDFPIDSMVIFHSFLYVYQRVIESTLLFHRNLYLDIPETVSGYDTLIISICIYIYRKLG